jgi:hypothetical protein
MIPFGFMGLVLLMYSLVTDTINPGGPDYIKEDTTFTAISPNGLDKTMGLKNMGVTYYEGELFNALKENVSQIGIAPNSTIANVMKDYFDEKNVSYKIFNSERDLIDCAEKPYKENGKMTNITIGISFTGSKDKDYSYKLLLDKSHFQDVSENYVDRLQKYY